MHMHMPHQIAGCCWLDRLYLAIFHSAASLASLVQHSYVLNYVLLRLHTWRMLLFAEVVGSCCFDPL